MKNNFIDIPSMIKATCTLTATLFIFAGCGGGGSGDNTVTSYDPSTVTALELIPPKTSSDSSLKIKSVEETKITAESASIKWELNEYAMGQIEYGFDETYGDVSIKEESFNYATHKQHLNNLESDTIYHYRIISEDADGNSVVSENRIFKTKSVGTVLSEPTPEQGSSTNTSPSSDAEVIVSPEGATVIAGLQAGSSASVAIHNSTVLNTAFNDGVPKDLIIPSGHWYIDDTLYVNRPDMTITWEGQLEQIYPNSDPATFEMMRVNRENVTLNNPQMDMGGMQRDLRIATKSGTHYVLSCYGKYNTGGLTVNGGILEGGSSNNFHGGRNNTVFNGTIFRDAREHLVYAYGLNGNGNGTGDADGLTFNDCIFERPGRGNDPWESNHIQVRNYKNVEFNNCIISGKPENGHTQYAFLMTNVDGAVINDTTIKDYKGGIIYTGTNTKNVVFNRIQAWSAGSFGWIHRTFSQHRTVFNDSVFHDAYWCYGKNTFNNSTFKIGNKEIKEEENSDLIFDNCTWE